MPQSLSLDTAPSTTPLPSFLTILPWNSPHRLPLLPPPPNQDPPMLSLKPLKFYLFPLNLPVTIRSAAAVSCRFLTGSTIWLAQVNVEQV